MKQFYILAVLILLTACHKKIYTHDISFKGDTVVYQGRPYTGDIWTDDNTSGFFKTENGQLQELTFFHRNGKMAIHMKVSPQGAPHTEIFDDHGDSLDLVSFQQHYMDIYLKMAMVQGELMQKQPC